MNFNLDVLKNFAFACKVLNLLINLRWMFCDLVRSYRFCNKRRQKCGLDNGYDWINERYTQMEDKKRGRFKRDVEEKRFLRYHNCHCCYYYIWMK